MPLFEQYLLEVSNLAISAGHIIMNHYQKDLKVIIKEDQSPLTNADLDSNNIICSGLSKIDSTIPIVSEESFVDWQTRKEWNKFWLIDPLDGTKEFINKNGEFTVNIALIKNNKPVLGVIFVPVLSTLYFASQNYGSFKLHCSSNLSSLNQANKIQVNVKKKTDHLFFKLSSYETFLKKWISNDATQTEIKNKLNEWLSDGLVDWDITRDAPYFGFNIPGTKDKFFYVWLDAPIGYIASHKNYCEKNDKNFDEYWKSDSNCELYHFIGKDIAYFHALFWPAMLEGSGFRKPNAVYCHGFLTINGEKMSKSRGTFFNARTYLNHLNPEYLRYYFASRLADKIEDIDLNFDDFQSRVNSDLVGKIINIGSRCSKFINKDFSNELSATFNNEKIINDCLSHLDEIINNYEGRNFSTNIRLISSMADDINKYLDEEKPWVKIKDKNNHEMVQKICTDGMNLFRILIGYLKPVLPKISEKVENIMQCEPINWENIKDSILSKKIQEFKPIITRIDKDSLEGMINESGENNK